MGSVRIPIVPCRDRQPKDARCPQFLAYAKNRLPHAPAPPVASQSLTCPPLHCRELLFSKQEMNHDDRDQTTYCGTESGTGKHALRKRTRSDRSGTEGSRSTRERLTVFVRGGWISTSLFRFSRRALASAGQRELLPYRFSGGHCRAVCTRANTQTVCLLIS